jgi:hypothetical protein
MNFDRYCHGGSFQRTSHFLPISTHFQNDIHNPPQMYKIYCNLKQNKSWFDLLLCDWWFSPGIPVSLTNKIDHHDITEIMLKVALNTINQTNFCFVSDYSGGGNHRPVTSH